MPKQLKVYIIIVFLNKNICSHLLELSGDYLFYYQHDQLFNPYLYSFTSLLALHIQSFKVDSLCTLWSCKHELACTQVPPHQHPWRFCRWQKQEQTKPIANSAVRLPSVSCSSGLLVQTYYISSGKYQAHCVFLVNKISKESREAFWVPPTKHFKE